MNQKEIWDLVRRLRLRLVVDNPKFTVMKPRRRKSAILLDQDISYQTLSSCENNGANGQAQPAPDIIGHKLHGRMVANVRHVPHNPDKTTADMIANAGELRSSSADQVPNDYQFEIIRLRRRVDELECLVRDRDRRVVAAITMLEDELAMYRTLLHDHVSETHDGIMRRTIRIDSTLATLKEKGSKFYPPLEIPQCWRKK